MGKDDYRDDKPVRYRIVSIAHFLLWFLLLFYISKTLLLPALNAGKSFGFTRTSSEIVMTDFASHFNFAKKVWLSETVHDSVNSAYSVANHLYVTSKWGNSDSPCALPFGYSPTMIWLLAPLAIFSHAVAFCIFNLAGLLGVWWQTQPIRCRLGFGLMSFFSPLFYACMSLGQTSLITGTCLLFLSENTMIRQEDGRIKRTVYAAAALWILTAKPPLAMAAVGVLVALRRWQPILIASALTIVTTLIISPLLGNNWIYDYVTMISNYDLVQADKAYAWSLWPSHMATLRAILHVDFNVADNIASRISAITWLSALIFMMTMAPRFKLQHGTCWALGILFYLLLCPHVSSTEEIQLILLIPLCIPAIKNLDFSEFVLFALILFTPFFSPVFGPFFLNIRLGLFTAKILLIILIVYNNRKSESLKT